MIMHAHTVSAEVVDQELRQCIHTDKPAGLGVCPCCLYQQVEDAMVTLGLGEPQLLGFGRAAVAEYWDTRDEVERRIRPTMDEVPLIQIFDLRLAGEDAEIVMCETCREHARTAADDALAHMRDEIELDEDLAQPIEEEGITSHAA